MQTVEQNEKKESENPGATLVLLHGIGLGDWFWEPWLPVLRAQFKVLALNLHPPGQNQGFPDLVKQVETTLDGLEGPIILVGHSMGGLVAQVVASRRPLTALVLVCPMPPGQIRMPVPWSGLRETLRLVSPFLRREPIRISRAAYVKQGLNLLSDEAVNTWFPKIVPWPNQLLRDLARPPKVEVEKVECPVLILLGKEDKMVPWEKGRILGDLYEGTVWRYDNLAHSPPLEPEGLRMAQDLVAWALAPTRPKVLESEGFGPAEGIGHEIRRQRRGEAMKKRSAYGQKGAAR